MSKQSKIQSLIVKHLLDFGTLNLVLPDGIVLEIGTVKEGRNTMRTKADDYCYVLAQREGRKALLDSYNMGITFPDDEESVVYQEYGYDNKGDSICRVDVV